MMLHLLPQCPTDGVLTSEYGYRHHPIAHRRKFHKGIDIGAKKGTPIRSIWDGVVVRVRRKRQGYGRYVVIRSGDLYVLYAHMSKRHVQKGDRVQGGEIIGEVGQTGVATGPHLHLGLFRQGRHVDPWMVTAVCY